MPDNNMQEEGRQISTGGQSNNLIENIKWNNPPYGRATALSDELNNLFNLIKHLNEPEYITVLYHNLEISLVQKLDIMDRFIELASIKPAIEELKWSRELPSDTPHRTTLSDELDLIMNKLSQINDPRKILVDTKTSLLDKLQQLQSMIDDTYRGQDIESIGYRQTPKGHKSTLSNELSHLYQLINSINTKYDILTNKLEELQNEIRIVKERTNIYPYIYEFKILNDSYESGSTVNAIEVSWQCNKVMKNGYISIDDHPDSNNNKGVNHPLIQIADIKDYLGMDFIPSSGSILVPNIKIYEQKTVVLELIDDQDIPVSSSAEIKFLNRLMYGLIPYNTEINKTVLDRLVKSPLVENPYGMNLKIGNIDSKDYYNAASIPVIAFPHSWGIADYQLALYNTNGKWIHNTIEYTNHTGYKTPYDVYRLDKPISGIVIVSIKDTI